MSVISKLWGRVKTKSSIDSLDKRVRTSRFNPTRYLDPEGLARQLDEFRNGRFDTVGHTFDLIEDRDPTIKTVAPKRKKSVARHGWSILTVEDESNRAEAEAHREALEYFFDHLTVTDVTDENVSGGTRLLIRQMMNAIGVKYAVHEIVWQPQPDGMLTAELRHVPLWFFEHEGTRLCFLREYGQWNGEEMEPGEWLVTVGDNLMVASAICYMFKRLPFQDWLAYCEKFGIPGIAGKTTAKKGSAEWSAMEEAVAEFANEFAAVMSEGDHIELIERKGGGELPFQPLVDVCDRYIAALWRGADLSTISKGQGMGASLQQEESDILLADDIEMISETMQTQLARYVIEHRFGPGVEPLAYFQLNSPQYDTADRDIRIDEFLIRNRYPMSLQDLSERYRRPLPDKKETLLPSIDPETTKSETPESQPDPASSEYLQTR